jgi:hypothetical protein
MVASVAVDSDSDMDVAEGWAVVVVGDEQDARVMQITSKL